MSLHQELQTYLDSLTITPDNIGVIRRACFVPWESEWNGVVRDETASREASRPEAGADSVPSTSKSSIASGILFRCVHKKVLGLLRLYDLLDQIETRANAATRGPWYIENLGRLYVGTKSNQSCGLWNIIYSAEYENFTPEAKKSVEDNATFIAASRSDVPALVKALRRALDAIPTDGIRRDGWWYQEEAYDANKEILQLLSEQTGTAAASVQDGNAAHSPPDKQTETLEKKP